MKRDENHRDRKSNRDSKPTFSNLPSHCLIVLP